LKASNQQEIKWLNENANKLLTHYQFIIEASVAKFISRGFFQPQEKSELVQQINLDLLEKKIKKIQEQYNGSVFLRTYFSKVVYNLCLEIARSKKRQPKILDLDDLYNTATPSISALDQLAINDELLRLEGILKGLYPRKEKKILSLKLLLRIILKELDLTSFSHPETISEINNIRKHFFKNYEDLSDKEVFSIAVRLFNKFENKSNDGDSLRKWTQILADKIISLLNGSPPLSRHDRVSLKILMRLYFEKDK